MKHSIYLILLISITVCISACGEQMDLRITPTAQMNGDFVFKQNATAYDNDELNPEEIEEVVSEVRAERTEYVTKEIENTTPDLPEIPAPPRIEFEPPRPSLPERSEYVTREPEASPGTDSLPTVTPEPSTPKTPDIAVQAPVDIPATKQTEPPAAKQPEAPVVKNPAAPTKKPGMDIPAPDVPANQFSPLQSSIYYTPEIDVRKMNCEESDLRSARNSSGGVILNLCPKQYKTCLMEGSCRIQDKDESFLLTVIKTMKVYTVFAKSSLLKCPYGKGVSNICLDPFYTVAADLTYFKAGDVIFVKEVRGSKLPDGSLHSGYFIVRDMGYDIKGSNRFDFFTGKINPLHPKNPFHKIGLSRSTKFHFTEVRGELAAAFRKLRGLK